MFSKYRKGYRKPRRRPLFLLFFMAVAAAIFCFSGYKIFESMQEYHEGDTAYADIAAIAKENENIDFQALSTLGPNMIAWIYQPGTEIDYPIVQGKDNTYYLTHLYDGTVNKLGSIFMDYRNNTQFQDKNTILYGHNMKNGAMFASLMNYKEQSYFDAHPTLEIVTPLEKFTLEIFGGYVLESKQFDAKTHFDDEADFLNYVNDTIENSAFTTPVEVKYTDRIVTLYTCSYEYKTARFILLGVLKSHQ